MAKAKKVKSRVTQYKVPGHADGEWEIRIDGKPIVQGLFRSEVPYYRRVVEQDLKEGRIKR